MTHTRAELSFLLQDGGRSCIVRIDDQSGEGAIGARVARECREGFQERSQNNGFRAVADVLDETQKVNLRLGSATGDDMAADEAQDALLVPVARVRGKYTGMY